MPETNTPGQPNEQQAPGSAAEPVQPEPTPPASPAADTGSTHSAEPRAVFRVSPVAALFVLFLLVCMTPVAAGPYPVLLVLYFIPILLLGWILRTKTVADTAGITARTMFRSRHIGWDELRGLKLLGRTRTLAVLVDDSEIRLPEVRVRHLAQLAQLSGGRLPDPTAPAAATAEPPTTPDSPTPAPTTPDSPTPNPATPETASDPDAPV